MTEEKDDPVLKAAIQRAWGGQTAPEELRRRIENAISPRRAWWKRPIPLAVAAMLLVGFALTAFFVLRGPAIAGVKMPEAIANPLINTHMACVSRPTGHHLLPAVDDVSIAAARAYLANELKMQVIVTDDIGNGWIYAGAGKCRVDSRFSGHLVFRRNKQELSIFSVPADTTCNGLPDGMAYMYAANGYWLAGFAHGGGLYCVVGHDPDNHLEAREIGSIRDNLQDSFNTMTCRPGTPVDPALVQRVAMQVLADSDGLSMRPSGLPAGDELIHDVAQK